MLQLQNILSSPYTCYNYLSVIVITERTFNFTCQPQEEAGSAEEQPASNKADTYTVIMSSQQWLLFSLLPASHMA
jgi:hypothetical protein